MKILLDADPIPLPQTGEVHVWLATVPIHLQGIAAWLQLLSSEEHQRAASFKFEHDRLLFTARRGLLRQCLSRYTSLPGDQIQYQLNPFGKLSLPGSDLTFNLSHSADRVAFAFAWQMELGVDIEKVRPQIELAALGRSWFSPQEYHAWLALPPAHQLPAFYHIWTQKEAFIKARGLGLSLPLQDFSVAADPNQPGRLLAIRGEEAGAWQMVKLAAEPGWQAALCVQSSQPVKVKWMTQTLLPDSSV